MSVQGGQYLDRAGSRVRRWTWPDSVTSPGPQVPLSPTFISLNRHVGVRVLGQDKITVSFLAMGQQAKFNVGTRVQVLPKHTGSSTLRAWGSREAPIAGKHSHPAVGAPRVTPWCCSPEQQAAGCTLLSPTQTGAHAPRQRCRSARGCGVRGALPGRSPVSPAVSPRVTPALQRGGEPRCTWAGCAASPPSTGSRHRAGLSAGETPKPHPTWFC